MGACKTWVINKNTLSLNKNCVCDLKKQTQVHLKAAVQSLHKGMAPEDNQNLGICM